jgi:hypothetical protein
VALFRGAVQLCDLTGKCVMLTRQCDLGGTSQADAFTVAHAVAADAGARSRFRYILSERPLLRPFWIAESRLCYVDTGNPNSLAPTTGGNVRPPRARGQP